MAIPDSQKAFLIETALRDDPFQGKCPSLDGTYMLNAIPCSGRELVRQWAIAKGILPSWAANAKDYQLADVYSKRPYFNKIVTLTEENIYSGRRRQRNTATAYGLNLDDLAASPPPARQTPDVFTPPPISAEPAIPPEKLTLEALTKAADVIIGNGLAAVQRDLMAATEAAAKRAAATEVERIGLSDRVKQQIRDLATDSAKAVLAAHLPTRVEIVAPSLPSGLDLGLQHERFPQLLKLIGARGRGGYRLNIWLTGPTGSGKTTAVERATEALAETGAFTRYRRNASGQWYITNDLNADQPVDLNGLIYDSPFGGDSSLDADYKVIGYDKADGTFRWTTFLRIFCFGGVYIADEIDNWSPSALVALNAPLANGWVATPAGIMRRHPDSVIIAAANTWGLGATSDYVGRSKLDAATVNRFPNKLDWPYDEKLEMALAEADGGLMGRAWATIVQNARAEAKRQGLQVIFSPRNTYDGIAALHAGFDVREVVAMNLVAGLDPEYVKVLKLDQIETLPGLEAPASPPAPAASGNGHANPLAEITYQKFYDAVVNGRKLDAIKLFREYHDPERVGLAAARVWVEYFEQGLIEPNMANFASAAGLALGASS